MQCPWPGSLVTATICVFIRHVIVSVALRANHFHVGMGPECHRENIPLSPLLSPPSHRTFPIIDNCIFEPEEHQQTSTWPMKTPPLQKWNTGTLHYSSTQPRINGWFSILALSGPQRCAPQQTIKTARRVHVFETVLEWGKVTSVQFLEWSVFMWVTLGVFFMWNGVFLCEHQLVTAVASLEFQLAIIVQ